MATCSDSGVNELIAAVDLGSNSFHLIVARFENQQLNVVERVREKVQLASGLDHNNRLNAAICRRAYRCLEQFGQRLAALNPARVRVVGTSALRVACNAHSFCEQAAKHLGYPVEIIAGKEEARLIYLGATQVLPRTQKKQLVVDIGGGSTELIVGTDDHPHLLDSLHMGCVTFAGRYFKKGQISADNFNQAKLDAACQLAPISKSYRDHGWQLCAGCSGTIQAACDISTANQWSKSGISAHSLQCIRDEILKTSHVDALVIKGLKPERASVFPSGIAILWAIFEGFNLDVMHYCTGALREGVLFDMLGSAASHAFIV